MNTDLLKQRVAAAIDALAGDLLDVSHRIHAEPELAFGEHRAVETLVQAAQRHGLALRTPAYGLPTAFVADVGDAGPCVAVLSEYDALPELGHACGHNMIAAIGLGVTLALRALGTDLPGRVRYIGAPAEERGCGKELLARAGAFEGVDAAMMLHPAGVDAKAIRCLCLSEVFVTYTGRSAHASVNPEAGINALDALVLSYQSVAQLRQHLPSSQKVHGVFPQAGSAPNIVPDRTVAHYYVRAGTLEALAQLKGKLQACFESAALATGCTVALAWSEADYFNMKINDPLADAYEANMMKTPGRRFVPYTALPFGTTDMANVSHRVPSLHPLIACAPPEVVIHDARFAGWARSEYGDRAVLEGAKGLAMTAVDYMTDSSLRSQVDFAFQSAEVRSLAPDSLPVVTAGLAVCDCH